MSKTIYCTCALAMVVAMWPSARISAASRCYPTPRFVVLSGGLVSDTLTSLVWQRQASATAITWTAAQTYCPSGFRLPTGKELSSIVDFAATEGPTIDRTAFPDTPAEDFWTSTPSGTGSVYMWGVSFVHGGWQCIDATANYRVRCVRI